MTAVGVDLMTAYMFLWVVQDGTIALIDKLYIRWHYQLSVRSCLIVFLPVICHHVSMSTVSTDFRNQGRGNHTFEVDTIKGNNIFLIEC